MVILMPIKRRTNWTPEENERLKAMVASGVPLLKAAGAFNCKMNAIRTKARQLGTPFPTIREVRKKFTGDSDSSEEFRSGRLSCRRDLPALAVATLMGVPITRSPGPSKDRNAARRRPRSVSERGLASRWRLFIGRRGFVCRSFHFTSP